MDAAGNVLHSLANQRIAARGDEKRQKHNFFADGSVFLGKYSSTLKKIGGRVKLSIPIRSVSEGQFRRSLTYVSGYAW